MTDDPKDGVEKRVHYRSDLILKVQYADEKDFLSDYTENVSEGGIFIATDETFAQGDILDFEVSFPGMFESIRTKGVVKWCRGAREPDEPAGIGVEFLHDEEQPNGPLHNLISRLKENEETPRPAANPFLFRVLLVEDNMVVRDMFRYGVQKLVTSGQLKGARLEVTEADNGKQAWDILKSNTFHLLILDLFMPVMDGKQLIRNVRAEPRLKDVPIVVVSSGGAEDRKQALDAGADIFLPKPIKLKEMVQTIENLIIAGHTPKDT